MSGQSARSGENAGNAIKKGVGMFHGAGEAIRGNFNAALDAATGDRESAARQEEIAHRGATEMDQGYHRGAGAHSGLGGNNTASTNYGPHDTNVGNKLDPRFDSDMDHRGTTTGSTNHGPHDTNMGNKLDPRIDSDQDNRAATGSSNFGGAYGSKVNNGLDPRFNEEYGFYKDDENPDEQVKWTLQNREDLIIRKPGEEPTLSWQYAPRDNHKPVYQPSYIQASRRGTDPEIQSNLDRYSSPPPRPPRRASHSHDGNADSTDDDSYSEALQPPNRNFKEYDPMPVPVDDRSGEVPHRHGTMSASYSRADSSKNGRGPVAKLKGLWGRGQGQGR